MTAMTRRTVKLRNLGFLVVPHPPPKCFPVTPLIDVMLCEKLWLLLAIFLAALALYLVLLWAHNYVHLWFQRMTGFTNCTALKPAPDLGSQRASFRPNREG